MNALQSIPRGSFYDHYVKYQSLSSLCLVAQLCVSNNNDDKKIKFQHLTYHKIKPWIGAIDSKGHMYVWNYSVNEILAEGQMNVDGMKSDGKYHTENVPSSPNSLSHSVENGDDLTTGSESLSTQDPNFQGIFFTTGSLNSIKKAASPKLISRSLRLKSITPILGLAFYDQATIEYTRLVSVPPTCFEEILVILTTTQIIFWNFISHNEIKVITTDELNQQYVTSVEIFSHEYIFLGCSDGNLRIWSMKNWKIESTLDNGTNKELQGMLLLPITQANHTDNSTELNQRLLTIQADGKINVWGFTSENNMMLHKAAEYDIKEAFKLVFDASLCVLNMSRYPKPQSSSYAMNTVLTVTMKDSTIILLHFNVQNDTFTPRGFLRPGKGALSILLSINTMSHIRVAMLYPSTGILTTSDFTIKEEKSFEYSERNVLGTFDLKPTFPSAAKKLKLVSIWGGNSSNEFCCLTNHGLLVMQAPNVYPVQSSLMLALSLDVCGSKSQVSSLDKEVLDSRILMYSSPTGSQITSWLFTDSKPQLPNYIHNIRIPHALKYASSELPVLEVCPCDSSLVSVLLPLARCLEILKVQSTKDTTEKPNFSVVYSCTAVAFAWNSRKSRFAVLVPLEIDASTPDCPTKSSRFRAVSGIASRRKVFGFGKSSSKDKEFSMPSARSSETKPHDRQPLLSLQIYDINNDKIGLLAPRDQLRNPYISRIMMTDSSWEYDASSLYHILSGPYLGVVKFQSKNTTSVKENFSPRDTCVPEKISKVCQQSSVSICDDIESASASESQTSDDSLEASIAFATALLKLHQQNSRPPMLEFFDWEPRWKDPKDEIGVDSNITTDVDSYHHDSGERLESMKCSIPSPYFAVWDTITHRFCALVYSTKLKIYRFDCKYDNEMKESFSYTKHNYSNILRNTCLHELPCKGDGVKSIKWYKQTLFVLDNDQLTWIFFSQTRSFTFILARTDIYISACKSMKNEYPIPVHLDFLASTIIDVDPCSQKLLLGTSKFNDSMTECNNILYLDLSNLVLQVILLISIGQPSLAVAIANSEFSQLLCDWTASVLDAFGFSSLSLQLVKATHNCLVNISIKNCDRVAIFDLLKRRCLESEASTQHLCDSTDIMGASLFQQACAGLFEANGSTELNELYTLVMRNRQYNDALFIACLLKQEAKFMEATIAMKDFSKAYSYLVNKKKALSNVQELLQSDNNPQSNNMSNSEVSAKEVLEMWNAEINKSTAQWKLLLQKYNISPPPTIKLVPRMD